MSFLLDTHFVIELFDKNLGSHPALVDLEEVNVSVVSLWEAAIKSKMGKLSLRYPAAKWPLLLASADSIAANHTDPCPGGVQAGSGYP